MRVGDRSLSASLPQRFESARVIALAVNQLSCCRPGQPLHRAGYVENVRILAAEPLQTVGSSEAPLFPVGSDICVAVSRNANASHSY